MFIGHFGVALLAKPLAPKTSLGTLMLATSLPDLLAFVFLMLGMEHFSIQPGISAANPLNFFDITLSHSLAMDVVWGAVLAVTYRSVRHYTRGALVAFVLVLSHWLLDFVAHRPDMSLAPGIDFYVGLGLYDSVRATLIVEGLVWLIGIGIYVAFTSAEKRVGIYAFWGMVVLLTALWSSGIAGPPPPNAATVEITNILIFSAVVAWAYWIDPLREIKKSPEFSFLDRARF